jgi:Fur family ferric uptake transcriptional regulator
MQTSFRDISNDLGFRYSTVRAQLYDLLQKKSPCSLKSFIAEAKYNGFDTVSVYRTLDLFRKHNLVDEYGAGSSRMLQSRDALQESHQHFVRCSVCKKAVPFHSEKIEQYLDEVALKNNFKDIESHFVELVGVCKNCR